MKELDAHIDRLCALVAEKRNPQSRFILAIAGPPASGKSTLANALVQRLGQEAVLVPMDGFHLDNRVLEIRGHLSRKGAPHTFDADGFASLVKRIVANKDDVVFPVFNRDLDCAIAGAGVVEQQHKVVVFEGNYLLLDDTPWTDMRCFYDCTAFLDVPLEVLERRCVMRWQQHGWPDEKASAHIAHNDLPNIELVQRKSVRADLVLGVQ